MIYRKLHYFNYFRKFFIEIPRGIICQRSYCGQENLHDTGISVYDSVHKKIIKLCTKYDKIVSWYCCGPTVYDSAHIGHGRSYIHFDIIRRIMENIFGLNVVMVMNITDIDDKIISKANSMNESYRKVALRYEKEFFDDMGKLNILQPSIILRVTDHISDIIYFIQNLIESGHGYVTSDGSVYFSLTNFPNYGKFDIIQEEVCNNTLKRNPQDFVIWKTSKAGEPFWKSPWGNGRPGWHIECSTIASNVLGKSIDIHSGGVDLKFPHHENEEAQCCARYNVTKWVNYWIHTGHLYAKDKVKMSKSLQNTISISEFLKHYSVNHLRMFCLMIPYRNGTELKEETIEKAVTLDSKLISCLTLIESFIKGKNSPTLNEPLLLQVLEETRKNVFNHLSDDFNTSAALSDLFHLITVTNTMLTNIKTSKEFSSGSFALIAVYNYIKNIFQNFGYNFLTEEQMISYSVKDVMNPSITFRGKIRDLALTISKNDSKELLEKKKILLEACDDYRNELLVNGFELQDHMNSTSWKYTNNRDKASDLT